jgi:hypothetical protein
MLTADDGSPGSETVVASAEQIVRHAQTVGHLAERAELAHGAARQVGLDAAAYGKVCSFIPAHLNPMQERIAAVMLMSATALDVAGAALRSASAGYESVDAAVRDRMESVRPPSPRAGER